MAKWLEYINDPQGSIIIIKETVGKLLLLHHRKAELQMATLRGKLKKAAITLETKPARLWVPG